MSRPFASNPIWKLIDWLGDVTTIPETWVKPIFSAAICQADQVYSAPMAHPTPNAHIVVFGKILIDTTWWEYQRLAIRKAMPKFDTHGDSLYYNAPIFVRVMFPFYLGIQIRWSGATDKRAYVQCHVGWKLNGRLALALRAQSDKSAAGGMDFPNPGQGFGWEYAGK